MTDDHKREQRRAVRRVWEAVSLHLEFGGAFLRRALSDGVGGLVMSLLEEVADQKARGNTALRHAARAVLDRIYIFGLPDPHDKSHQMEHHRRELAKALNELERLCPR